MISSVASLSYAEIAAARVRPDQPLFFQLYKNRDDALAEERVREAVRLGYNAIFLTVDAPVQGNRSRDVRAGWQVEDTERLARAKAGEIEADVPLNKDELEEVEQAIDVGGTSGALIANDDIDMSWEKVSDSCAYGNNPSRLVLLTYH